MEFDEPRYAYKKLEDDLVCRLIIPPETPVVYPISSGSWNNEHLRVEEVIVDKIEDDERTRAQSSMHSGFWYIEGERVIPEDFNDDVTRVSAPGIHCFATRKGAVHW